MTVDGIRLLKANVTVYSTRSLKTNVTVNSTRFLTADITYISTTVRLADCRPELTFDYMDKDEIEEEVAIQQREEAARDPSNTTKQPYNYRVKKCKGLRWV